MSALSFFYRRFLLLFCDVGYDICPRTCDMERAPSGGIRQKIGCMLPELQGEDGWFHDLIYIGYKLAPAFQTACDFIAGFKRLASSKGVVKCLVGLVGLEPTTKRLKVRGH